MTNMKAHQAALTTHALGDPSFYDRCLAGELVLINDFVQQSGLQEIIGKAIYGAVARQVGQPAAQQLKVDGLASAHRVIPEHHLVAVAQQAEAELYRNMPAVAQLALGKGLGMDTPVYLARKPLLRLQVPLDAAASLSLGNQSKAHGYVNGRIAALRPHRDTWYTEPPDGINIWIALTDIRPGNGMSFYPYTDGLQLSYQPSAGVDLNDYLGPAYNLTIPAGAVLLFASQKLHASELNHSDQTRAVLSLRISHQRPVRQTNEPWRYLRVHPGRRLSRSRLHPAWSEVSRRVCAASHMLAHRDFENNDHCTPAPKTSAALPTPKLTSEEQTKRLQDGRAVAISATHCLALDAQGTLRRFRRRCPHQGADLSLGHVFEGKLHCPWHNLPFDLDTGRSPCMEIADIGAEPWSEGAAASSPGQVKEAFPTGKDSLP